MTLGADGTIFLNPKLVSATLECIEYVIFHELSHLLHREHDDDFFRVLKGVCPNYKVIKERLDMNTILFEE